MVILGHLFDINPNHLISGIAIVIFDFCQIEIIIVTVGIIIREIIWLSFAPSVGRRDRWRNLC